MIKFIFFGRLQHEKGIDLILDVFPRLYAQGMTNWSLDIYGEGKFSEACKAMSELLPDNVFSHGWVDQKTINRKLAQVDYCLMPSRVIETFGLSALEALQQGVPVIGFKKGGLEKFIISELDITPSLQHKATDRLYDLIYNICTHQIAKDRLPIDAGQLGLSIYTSHSWLENFKAITGDKKRILIVSDFTKKIGGIESYIHDAKDLLTSNGYDIQLRGSDKRVSFGGLLKTALNIRARRKLHKVISHFEPDIIRYNSVSRELGRLPLIATPKDTKTLMMFHDMGYFVPRPSKLYAIHGAHETMSLLRRLRLSHSKNPLSYILAICKRISLRMIRGVFRKRDTTYLVPSAFMKELVEKWRAGKDQKTIVLPHFVK